MTVSPENFYKETITRAVSLVGATNIYVSALPTPDEGYIVISPANTNLREIVYYTAKGSDSNGSFITVTLANRGLGGTTAQTHVIGEPVRGNVVAEHIQDLINDIDAVVAGGAVNASTVARGLVEEATDAEAEAETDTGATGARLFVPPSKFKSVAVSVSTGTPTAAKLVKTDDDGMIGGSFTRGIVVNVYTASTTWTKPDNLKYVEVELVGGGGGGQGIGDGGGGGANSGSGAGGGGYSYKKINASELGATETVTIGAAGAGGIKAVTPSTAGGTTSFGSHCSATGGGAGNGTNAGDGGIGSGGDLNIKGQAGQISSLTTGGGLGGSSKLGGGGWGGKQTAGGTGGQYGGGGGAAQTNSGGVGENGGDGAAGVVIVTEHYI